MSNLNLRLDKDLKEKIKMAAEIEGLSVVAFIIQTIKRYANAK
jgi:uncharacterized protein (DUF1778 family)